MLVIMNELNLLSSEDFMSIFNWRYGFAALRKATSKSQSEARERYISVPLRSRDRKLIPKLCLLIDILKEEEMSALCWLQKRISSPYVGDSYPFKSKALISMCCRTSRDVIWGSTAKDRNSTGRAPSHFWKTVWNITNNDQSLQHVEEIV